MEFRGILSLNEYLAFGISGSPTETSMVGSDVSVVWFDPSDSEPRAEDYHLNAYSQVKIYWGGGGVVGDGGEEIFYSQTQILSISVINKGNLRLFISSIISDSILNLQL